MRMLVFSLLVLFGSASMAAESQTAIFAGGCFWCMQSEFESVPGVSKVVAGYTGGHTEHPTYEEVSSGTTGHVESIQVTYDPHKVSYQKLLDVFWSNVDPTDEDGQFCDKGSQYRAAIFTADGEQATLAAASLEKIKKKFSEPVAAFIQPATTFWPAEDYHQDYYKKNSMHYKMYRYGCGRDQRLDDVHKEMGQP